MISSKKHSYGVSTLHVGDVVRVKSKEWYVRNRDEYGTVVLDPLSFYRTMSPFCGCYLTISHIEFGKYIKTMEVPEYTFTEEMLDL